MAKNNDDLAAKRAQKQADEARVRAELQRKAAADRAAAEKAAERANAEAAKRLLKDVQNKKKGK